MTQHDQPKAFVRIPRPILTGIGVLAVAVMALWAMGSNLMWNLVASLERQEPAHAALHVEMTRLEEGLHGLLERLGENRGLTHQARFLTGLEPEGPVASDTAGRGMRFPAAAAIADKDLARLLVETRMHLEGVLVEARLAKASFGEIAARMEERSHEWASIPSLTPVDQARLTSGFGMRRDPFTGRWKQHLGLDFAAPIGTPVLASAAGFVKRSKYVRGYGYLVDLDHGNGIETRYGHNSRLVVRAGDWVKRGQVLAYVGSTGRASAPHLHYEVRVNGAPANPRGHIFAGAVVAE